VRKLPRQQIKPNECGNILLLLLSSGIDVYILNCTQSNLILENVAYQSVKSLRVMSVFSACLIYSTFITCKFHTRGGVFFFFFFFFFEREREREREKERERERITLRCLLSRKMIWRARNLVADEFILLSPGGGKGT
jgi:hypothetical protein